ncbi:hypothetical protein TNCV_2751511 [Trichonephila clavipes]|nr:hypothetical protein TNCV_2751511 [Trichonephila clavipes]
MDLAFLLEICFYMVVWVKTILFYGHLPYFSEILEYVAIVEVFKKYFLPKFEQTQQLDGNLTLSEQTKRRPENDSVPIVQSAMVFEICQSLGLQARLAPEEERIIWVAKNKKHMESKPTIPVVKSEIIYQMCKALDIEAVLSLTINQDIVTLKPNQKPVQNKPLPLVRSVMVHNMCHALGLETKLIFE